MQDSESDAEPWARFSFDAADVASLYPQWHSMQDITEECTAREIRMKQLIQEARKSENVEELTRYSRPDFLEGIDVQPVGDDDVAAELSASSLAEEGEEHSMSKAAWEETGEVQETRKLHEPIAEENVVVEAKDLDKLREEVDQLQDEADQAERAKQVAMQVPAPGRGQLVCGALPGAFNTRGTRRLCFVLHA
jgi:hypothetical protein